ncbi:MAG: ABC transporter permease [Parcubacteria group bacterium]|nr:ABC transporter permease [Parcubacteria group bacterium]
MSPISEKQKIILPFIVPLFLFTLWEWSVRSGLLPNTIIASPSQVVRDFFELMTSGKLLIHSLVSFYRLVIGFAIGTFIGLSLGVIVGTSKFAEKLIAPTIQFLAPIPPIAWIPLLIILFGIGEGSKIGLMIIASFVVVYLNTIQGIRSTDQKIIDVAHVLRKSNKELIKKVLLPSATPHIFTGMRIALGLSWILLIAAEVIASSKGLGWLIWDSRNFSRPDDLFVGIITIGILGKFSDMALILIEKELTQWRTVFQGK